MKIKILLLAIGFVSLSLVQGQDGKIQELIERLGAEDFKVREEATEELKKIGQDAEPYLKKALNHKDPEVRYRAEYILSIISFIIFVRHSSALGGKEWGIWRIGWDGEDLKQLTQRYPASVALSPDGRHIAFIEFKRRHETQFEYSICIMKSDGKDRKEIITEVRGCSEVRGCRWISWSPDSKKLLFTGGMKDENKIKYCARTVNIESGKVEEISLGDCKFPRYSPDGKKIAFVSGGPDVGYRLNIYDTESRKRRTIFAGRSQRELLSSPCWSPDGKKIFFASSSPRSTVIYKVDVNKGDVEEILEEGKSYSEAIPLALSPDGRRLACCIQGRLYVIGVDGEDEKRFADISEIIRWSKDGERLAVVSTDGFLSIINISRGSRRNLLKIWTMFIG
jgi:Tol biopolymer transport system component